MLIGAALTVDTELSMLAIDAVADCREPWKTPMDKMLQEASKCREEENRRVYDIHDLLVSALALLSHAHIRHVTTQY